MLKENRGAYFTLKLGRLTTDTRLCKETKGTLAFEEAVAIGDYVFGTSD